MALSWNEIKSRALEFQNEYLGTIKENAETQSFYNDFFNVFGISRRRVASFEEPVKKLGDKRGRIEFLFDVYETLTQPLLGKNKKNKKWLK